MLEGFYRRGLLRYKTIVAGQSKIIEPKEVFLPIHSRLGVVDDFDIRVLFTVYRFAHEEWVHACEMRDTYEQQHGKKALWSRLEADALRLGGEANIHLIYLQSVLREHFKVEKFEEDPLFIYLYQGWIASYCSPYEWAYNTEQSPMLLWGQA
jgi:hypothetical protein